MDRDRQRQACLFHPVECQQDLQDVAVGFDRLRQLPFPCLGGLQSGIA
jgi:hypothetical protein